MSDKQTLKDKALYLRDLINQARATVNPFKAKELKSQIEALTEAFTLEVVATVDFQANQIRDLQKQIGRLDARLGQLGG